MAVQLPFAYISSMDVMRDQDDAALLKAIADADKAAFTEFCGRFQVKAFNVAIRTLNDSALAEDAVQEAMLALWLTAKSYHPSRGNPQSWALGIVVKKSLDLRRRRKRSSAREERVRMEEWRTEVPAAGVEKNELIGIMRQHIDQLPELECTLLACCYGASMPHREIAKIVGVSQQTVSNRIHATLEKLRGSLAKAGVTAVVPLVTAENLFDAMTSGHPCPPHLPTQALRRIENHKDSVRVKARRKTAPKAGAAQVAIPALVVAGLALAWLSSNQSGPKATSTPSDPGGKNIAVVQQPAPPAPVTLPREVPPAPAEVNDDVNEHWSFEKGAPSDLKILFGTWNWSADDGGQMVPLRDAELVLSLPLSIPTRPMAITMKCVNPGLPSGGQSFTPIKGSVMQACRKWSRVPNFNPEVKKFIKYTIYFTGRYQVRYSDDQITSVTEYKKPIVHDGMMMMVRNLNPKDIDIKTVSPDELPLSLRNFPKLIESMGVEPHDIEDSDISSVKRP